MRKHNFPLNGPTNSGKTTLIRDFCSLYETVNVLCYDLGQWDGCIIYNVNDLNY